MSSVTTLARPYAKAAFALAQDEQAHDSPAPARWEDMLVLAATIAGTVRRVFDDAAFQQRLSALGVERDFRPATALLEAMQRDDRIWAAATQAGHIRPQQ